MNKIADILEENLEAFAQAESKDQVCSNAKPLFDVTYFFKGKPVSLARTVDIPRAVWNFRFFAGMWLSLRCVVFVVLILVLFSGSILHTEGSATQMDGMAVNYTMRTPLGVCL